MKQEWKVVTLGDVCEKGSSGVSQNQLENEKGPFPIYGASGFIKNVSFYHNSKPYLSIVKDGSGFGRVTKMEAYSSVIGTLQYIFPKDGIDLNYLYYSLITIDFKKYVAGAAIPHIYFKDYKNEPILWMPLPEQQRIVAILDEAFSAIDQAKAKTEQNLRNAKELFDSYLQEIFDNPGGGWSKLTLGDVSTTQGRIGWKGLTAKEYTSEGPFFLSVHSLNYGDFVDFRDANHISQERYDESPEIMLKKDDILICKDGAGIGKLAIVPELLGPTTINSSLLMIRSKGRVLTKFLYYNLLSFSFQRIVYNRLSGATTPHLYQRDIVTFPVFIPSIQDQQTVVSELDTLKAETQKLEALYKKKLSDLDEFKKSILQKAFAGELTTA